MKKEALFAIIIGIIVGLGITYGIYHFRQALTPSTSTTTPTPLPNPTTSPDLSGEKLIITSPENEAILAETSTTLSGTTEANQLVVVFVNDNEYMTQADEIGAFAVEITLDAGSNVITVTSIAADGTQLSKELVVVVSTASLEPVEQTATTPASPSASTAPATQE